MTAKQSEANKRQREVARLKASVKRVEGLLKRWWAEIEQGPADPLWFAIGVAEQLEAALNGETK